MHLPDDNHVAVHLLKSLLGHLEAVARGIELVGLEGLVAEADVKRLIVGLVRGSGYISMTAPYPLIRGRGHCK